MVTLMEARPEVRAIAIRCEGVIQRGRRAGQVCDHKLAIVVRPFTGKIVIRCPVCGADRVVE